MINQSFDEIRNKFIRLCYKSDEIRRSKLSVPKKYETIFNDICSQINNIGITPIYKYKNIFNDPKITKTTIARELAKQEIDDYVDTILSKAQLLTPKL